MIGYIKLFLIFCTRFLLHIFYVFPIKNNRVVFSSYSGKQYSCNPKYISIYLNEHYHDQLKYIWVIKDPKKSSNFPSNVKLVKYNSLQYFYYVMTCNVFVLNGLSISYIPFRKKQTVIGTWHGGGAYKKGGLDVIDTPIARKNAQLISLNVNYIISSCKKFTESMCSAFLLDKNKFLEIGMPRNDLLFIHASACLEKKIKDFYSIPITAKIVLYAPTFRSKIGSIEYGFEKGEYDLNIQGTLQSLQHRFGGQWFLMFRSHYHLKKVDSLKNIIDVTDYHDMQELLLVADVLINDYSSSMWDFSLTGKPCFIYAKDIKEYEKVRGFYTSLDAWPFPLATNNDELICNIEHFDYGDYKTKIDRHHNDLGCCETGEASKIVGDKIYKICLGKDRSL